MHGERILELIAQQRESRGERLMQELRALGWSTYTFETNFRELHDYLRLITEDERGLELLPLMNRDKQHAALRELIRRFHNFMAAALSLREHTYTFRKHWYDNPARDQVVTERVREAFTDLDS